MSKVSELEKKVDAVKDIVLRLGEKVDALMVAAAQQPKKPYRAIVVTVDADITDDEVKKMGRIIKSFDGVIELGWGVGRIGTTRIFTDEAERQEWLDDKIGRIRSTPSGGLIEKLNEQGYI
jgi:hypothetical protein